MENKAFCDLRSHAKPILADGDDCEKLPRGWMGPGSLFAGTAYASGPISISHDHGQTIVTRLAALHLSRVGDAIRSRV